jgi:hypothetical protein
MPGYDHHKKACFNYDLMRQAYPVAKARAERLAKSHRSAGTKFLDQNPSSNMYHVLDKIIAGGEK